ncbi:MAG: AbrB/MazE/SpoVT family DNA-binding domain-containing protein [Phyllobacteriaceae bacterium]|nr:AbrB/MazE/SpoVT family DNA-binding domain-containing protein [Phyllobacteriaceae bacterium]
MRVTEKGQVTIPKPIRDKLGIVPGSEVEFVDEGKVVRLENRRAGNPAKSADSFDAWLMRARGQIDTAGRDGKAFVDWLRGTRDDLDAG